MNNSEKAQVKKEVKVSLAEFEVQSFSESFETY
jgi:hypothetical protein